MKNSGSRNSSARSTYGGRYFDSITVPMCVSRCVTSIPIASACSTCARSSAAASSTGTCCTTLATSRHMPPSGACNGEPAPPVSERQRYVAYSAVSVMWMPMSASGCCFASVAVSMNHGAGTSVEQQVRLPCVIASNAATFDACENPTSSACRISTRSSGAYPSISSVVVIAPSAPRCCALAVCRCVAPGASARCLALRRRQERDAMLQHRQPAVNVDRRRIEGFQRVEERPCVTPCLRPVAERGDRLRLAHLPRRERLTAACDQQMPHRRPVVRGDKQAHEPPYAPGAGVEQRLAQVCRRRVQRVERRLRRRAQVLGRRLRRR